MAAANIFITAYDVNPFKGSESGMGWNFTFEIAQLEKVILVTRENNRHEIELWISQNEGLFNKSQLTIVYYDLPGWVLRIKSGPRFWLIYYSLWQFFVALRYRGIIRTSDIAHALNFGTDAVPSFLWLFNRNFFWGPINHHEKIPFDQLVLLEGYLAAIKGSAGWILKLLNWRLNPFLLLCQFKAKTVFVGSSSVLKRWYGPKTSKFVDLSCVGIASDFGSLAVASKEDNDIETFRFLSVGRFVSMKSFELTVLAYARFLKLNPEAKDTELTLIGQGPNLGTIQKFINGVPKHGNVKVISWIDYAKLPQHFHHSDVFVFPSHEGAGMVVAEALASGLPVVCLDNNGPLEIAKSAAIPVKYDGFFKTKDLIAIEMSKLYNNKDYLRSMSQAAKIEAKNYFWSMKARSIVYEYHNS